MDESQAIARTVRHGVAAGMLVHGMPRETQHAVFSALEIECQIAQRALESEMRAERGCNHDTIPCGPPDMESACSGDA